MSLRKLKKAPLVREPRENMSKTQAIVGLSGRAFVLFLCVLGSCLFIGDAAGIVSPASDGYVSASVLCVVVSALLFSATAAIASYDRRSLAVAPVAGAAVFVGVLSIFGNPFALLWDGIRFTWNSAIDRIGERYMSFTEYRLADGYAFGETTMLNVGMAILAAILALVFALCLIRRARLVPTVIVCALIVAPVFTYNLTRHTAGVAFAIVFMAAALSLCMFDRRYLGREFAYIAKHERRQAKKAARKQKRAERREKRETRRRREIAAYERALEVTDEKSLAREARRAVGKLERQAKKEKLDKEKEEKKERKKAAKKAKKEQKAQAAKDKKKAAAERKRLAAAAKKDKALAARLAAEKKAKNSDRAAAKKKKRLAKRNAERAKNEKRLQNAAGGGVAGLLAAAIALACVAIPALAISGKFPIIPFINEPVAVAREYVTAYLKGDDVDLNNLDIYDELSGMVPRKLSFEPLEFKGTQIFAATGDLAQNVYLRSWIARDFDEQTQQWMGSDRDQVLEYRSEFSKEFSPDEIRSEFNALVNPSSAYIVDNGMLFARQGFGVEKVNLRRINSPSKLIFVPATMNSRYGILAYGGTEPIDLKYSHFYDGIYSSRFFDERTKYTTVSFISDLRDPNVATGIEDQKKYFSLALSYLSEVDGIRETLRYRELAEGERTEVQTPAGRVYTVSAEDLSDIDVKFNEELKAAGVRYTGDSIVKRALEDPQIYERMLDYLSTEEEYRKYARETYTTTFGGDRVAELADELLSKAGYARVLDKNGELTGFTDAEGRDVPDHTVVMTVIDFLRENNVYTLTPSAPEDTEQSVLDAFLFDTKEGYCTHYATAACALLRSYGYPVRFCEGYVANDFHTNYGEKVDAKFMTMVHDDDAHAWIEVYFDGIGWMQYEATSEYAAPMYDSGYVIEQESADPSFTHSENVQPQPEPTPAEPEPIEQEAEEEEFDYAALFTAIGIVVGAIALIAVIMRLIWGALKRRADKEIKARRQPVEKALADARRSGEENRQIALELNDQIMEVFAIAGFVPEDGEGVAEFSERVSEVFAGLSETPIEGVVDAMMRAEFGRELERSDLIVIGDFISRLVPSVYSGLPRLKKLWWRYIKRRI